MHTTQGLAMFMPLNTIIPYILFSGLYCMRLRCFGGFLAQPYILGGQGYEPCISGIPTSRVFRVFLARYDLRSPTWVYPSSFLLYRLGLLVFEYFTIAS